MKKFVIALFLLMGCVATHLYAQKPVLKFNKDGKFKIVQFTDVHNIFGDPKTETAFVCINEVLDAEKPDLVIFTGDVIFGSPAEESMRSILDLASKRQIPFGVTFGNHDGESDLNLEQLLAVIKTIPYNLTDTAEGVSGYSNYTLPILSSDGKGKTVSVLYCLDTHRDFQLYYQCPEIKTSYPYIDFDQIVWYREQSKRYTQQNGGKPLPALAFFHIPLPEHKEAALRLGTGLIGTVYESPCSPVLNTGMFTSMEEMGDVKGVFVGHDHDNDYAVKCGNILLAYGRYTGGNTVYNHLLNGARVIEMTEGETGFDTWIRLRGGEIINKMNFPETFNH